MKQWAIISLITLSIVSCKSVNENKVSDRQETEITEPIEAGITMSVSPRNYTSVPEKIELTITNHTDNEIQFGANYTIEKFNPDNQEWQTIEFPEGIAFIAIMYILPANESNTYDIYLYAEQVNYSAGQYRIHKQIWIDEENKSVYAEFEVE